MTPITKSRIQAGITQAATMLLTVIAWVAAQGSNPLAGLLPDSVWQWVTMVAALLLGVWNGWKNQNWTQAAVAAQSLLDQIKTGDQTQDEAAVSTPGVDESGDVTPVSTDVTPSMTGETLPTGPASTGAASTGATA